ncbi:MAG: hypothetical protein ISS48_02720 [Candidatus Aenigmarchaeota archaeon]|nr:hypothetical protein [Candidatus Aenigmarchaeota archaeon]
MVELPEDERILERRIKLIEEGPCSTPFKWTIHSNDSKYVDNFLLLPERVDLLWNFLKDKLPFDKPLKDRSVWEFV